MNNFKQDEKDFLNYYLDNDAFPLPNDSQIMHINKHGLELIIRPNCNQHCEYCYINKYGDKLYPNHNISSEELLSNIQALLEYIYIERKNYFYKIEMFAGDVFYDGIFFKIMQLYDNILSRIKSEFPYLLERKTTMILPSNLSFVYTMPEVAEETVHIHDYFLETYNFKIAFSWSTDGIYGTFDREKKKLDDDYFDTILDFCMKLDAGYHPMTSANNVYVLKDNYDWWLQKMKEHRPPEQSISEVDFAPSFLEVRNGKEWDQQAIEAYLDFLSYAMQVRYELCGSDSSRLAKHFFGDVFANIEEDIPRCTSYDHLAFNYTSLEDTSCENIPCGVQSELHVNCVDLSLVPCHRTSYPIFTGCYFKKDKDTNKIIDVEPHNISGYYTLKTAHYSRLPVCSTCEYSPMCLKGCYGAQYEDSGEIFMPIPSVCSLFQQKIDHLVKLYHKYGVFKEVFEKHMVDMNMEKWFKKKLEEMGYTYE